MIVSNSSQMRGLAHGLCGDISGDMYKLWNQSSCSVHSHNIIKQYIHTVAYMALHAQDTPTSSFTRGSDSTSSVLNNNAIL